MDRWNSITYGLNLLFRLPVALKLTPTSSRRETPVFSLPSYHFDNLSTIILVLGANMYAELDMSLDMFKWQPFEENCTRSRRRKTRFYELSRHKRAEKFCKELKFNSRYFPTSLSLSLSCEKRNKKKQGIPKHFYASTCTRESRIPRSKDRPLRTHFVKTLTTEFQFLSSPFTSSYRVWPGKQSCCSKNIRIRAVRSIINIYMHSVNFCLFKIVLKIFKTRSFINQVFTNKRD